MNGIGMPGTAPTPGIAERRHGPWPVATQTLFPPMLMPLIKTDASSQPSVALKCSPLIPLARVTPFRCLLWLTVGPLAPHPSCPPLRSR